MADKRFYDFGKNKTNEFNLYRKLQDEAVQIFGVDCWYLPRSIQDINPVFDEDTISRFEDKKEIRVYVDDVQGWGGENDLYSKFGIEITDEMSVRIEKERFKSDVGTEPVEGDLIFFPLGNILMEIMHVEDEMEPFYAFRRPMVYIFNLKPFKFAGEEMVTGIDAVDNIETEIPNITKQNDDFDTEDADVIDFSEDQIFGDFGS